MSKTIDLDIPRTAEERISKEAISISSLIKRIEARASDGRYYLMEDSDREAIIRFLKHIARTQYDAL